MGWFEDAVGVAANPWGYAAGQIAGGEMGKNVSSVTDPFNGARKKYFDGVTNPKNLIMPGLGMIDELTGGGAESAAPGFGGIPDYTADWEKLAQGLNTDKLGAEKDIMQNQLGSNMATARSALAMKGGLSAGADERLANNNQLAFGDAYSNLATKYGLGSAEISKQGLEKKQQMALDIAMGQDKANAIRNSQPKGLLGLDFMGL